jgi:hypothetical protein
MVTIQDACEGPSRVGGCLERLGLGRKGRRVRGKPDLLGTRASSDARAQGDLQVGARAATWFVL